MHGIEFYQKNFFIALKSYAQFQKTFFLEIGHCKDVLN